MKKIALTTKEELNIYMSPVRQQLLRELSLTNTSMTSKMLADKLLISASSVQHHIRKLVSLGVIELDHVEIINGITAKFYKSAPVTVQIGLSLADGLDQQREVLLQDSIARVYEGYIRQMKETISGQKERDLDILAKSGDILSGVIYLEKHESEELMSLITGYLVQHACPTKTSTPWEYAMIAYKAAVSVDD